MNPAKLANALRKLGEASYELADALLDQPQAAPAAEGARASDPPQTALASQPEMSPFLDGEEEAGYEPFPPGASTPQGSEAQCPKHRKPYKDGRYGAFCTSTTDDSAWGKERDGKLWCRITPKNAAEWLRVTATA